MTNQDDIFYEFNANFRANHHPLDKKTQWNKIPDHLVKNESLFEIVTAMLITNTKTN